MKRILSFCLISLLMTLPELSPAGDLDDGIPGDDSIKAYDTMGRPSKNIRYIVRSAKAKARSAAEGGEDMGTGSGDSAIGGAIIKPGAEVREITIIFEGEDITAVTGE